MKTEKMPDAGKECLGELVDVLSRYQGKLYRDDAKDIVAHLAMVFEGQDEKSAARLLHESGMDLVFFHGLALGWEDKEGGESVRLRRQASGGWCPDGREGGA